MGKLGITVNAVAPGFVETEMTDETRRRAARANHAPQRARAAGVEVEDVANAVEFLLSDKAANITGTVLTVDAGSTA